MVDKLERLMDVAEVAELLGVPVATLYRWRYLGQGPRGYRIGRHVRYSRAAVAAWLEKQADERIAG
jgi:excisionase family DNA binding protein